MGNPSRRRPVHNVVHTAVVMFLAAVTLSGCSAAPVPVASSTADPVAEATTAPTEPPPIFASNDEALAAAKAAYATYAALSDDIMRRRSAAVDFSGFSASVSATYLPQVAEARDSFTKAGHVGQGASSFDSVTLVQYSDSARDHAEVEVYMCSDVSGLRLLDVSGVDVTPADRIDRVPLQVSFISSGENPSKLLVDKEDVWSGRDFC